MKLPGETFIFIVGTLCSGKTTLLNQIMPKFDKLFLIDKDDISDSFLMTPDTEKTKGEYDISWFNLAGPKISMESSHYKDFVQKQTYRAMLEIAESNLRFGYSSILQGNYTGQIKDGYFEKVVPDFLKEKNISPRIKIIFCHAPAEVIKKRMKERKLHRDIGRLGGDEFDKLIKNQELALKEIGKVGHVKASGVNPVSENVEEVISYLLK